MTGTLISIKTTQGGEELINHDELGTRAAILGGIVKECLESLPLMSEDIQKKVARIIINDIVRDRTANPTAELIFSLEFKSAKKAIDIVFREARKAKSEAYDLILKSSVVSTWINRHRNEIARNIGVGIDSLGRNFRVMRLSGSRWEVICCEHDKDRKKQVYSVDDCSCDEEAHDRWIEISSSFPEKNP